MTNRHAELNDSQARDLVGQVERLTAQVETLAQALTLQKRSRTRAYRWVAIAGSLVAVATVAGVATSQEADCDLSLPFCFGSGEPARATEVNQNFSALAEDLSDLDAALASKVDQDENGNVNIAGQLGIKISRKNCSAELAAEDAVCGAMYVVCAAVASVD